MAHQVDWLIPWKKSYSFRSQDEKKNAANKKAKFEELKKYLENVLKRRNKGKTSDKQHTLTTVKWKPLKENKHVFRLVAYLSPSAIEKPKKKPGPGGGDSIITPKTPKQP